VDSTILAYIGFLLLPHLLYVAHIDSKRFNRGKSFDR
jgi:hypothetical protein